MGFENSNFGSGSFNSSSFGSSAFSGGNSSSGNTDIEHKDAWLWEDGSYILWESNDLILLEL